MQHNDDGNASNKGGNPSSRYHPNDRRTDFRIDTEYNSSKYDKHLSLNILIYHLVFFENLDEVVGVNNVVVEVEIIIVVVVVQIIMR